MATPLANKGAWDASAGTFPSGSVTAVGDYFSVSVAGTVDSVDFDVDDILVAESASPSSTVFSTNWSRLDVSTQIRPKSSDELKNDHEALVTRGTYMGFVEVSNSATPNINASATGNAVSLNLQFLNSSSTIGDSNFTAHTSNNRVTCNFDGVVEIDAHVGIAFGTERYNGKLYVTINGVRSGVPGKSGYIRAQTNHDESSMHVNGMIIAVSDGDHIALLIDRETSATGSMFQTSAETLLCVRRIR